MAKDLETKDESDDSFDRMSNDDLAVEFPPVTLPNSNIQIDSNGVKWTTIYSNDDWLTCKKIDRWIVNEGMRSTHEFSAKDQQTGNSNKLILSTRLNHIMERILGNLTAKKKKK